MLYMITGDNNNKNIEQIRTEIIDTSLIIASIIGSIAYLISITRIFSTGFHFSFFIELGLIIIVLLVTFRRKRLTNVWKSYFVIALIFFFALSDAIIYGVFSSVRIYLLLIPFFSLIYLSMVKTIVFFSISILSFLLTGYFHYKGFLVIPEAYDPQTYVFRFYPWIINGVHITTVAMIIFFVSRKFIRTFYDFISESEKSNQIISESERNYREIFNSTNESIFIQDAEDGSIVDVNDVMVRMFGFSEKQDVLDCSIADLSSEEYGYDAVSAREKVEKTLHEGPQVFEWMARRKNGEPFRVEVSLQSTSIGGIGRVLAVVRDIGERKLAEQALRQSEEKYRTLMESLNEVIMLVDNEDRVQYVNKKFTEILGYEPEEIIGEIGYKILLDPEGQKVIINVNEERKKKVVSQYELNFKAKDGKRIDFLVSGTPITNEEGVTIGSLGAMMDITERKKAEEALKESEEKYRTIIEAFPDIIMLSDINGNIIFGNKALERITGITTSDYNNPERKARIYPDDIHYVSHEIDKLLKGDQLHTGIIENRFVDRWGKVHWFSGIISKLVLKDKVLLQTISRDITEKKEIEQELDRYRDHLELLVQERTEELEAINEELMAANEELTSQREDLEAAIDNLHKAQEQLIQAEKMASLGILAAGVAHEINNPLNFIAGGIQGLEIYLDENLKEHFEEVGPLMTSMNEGVKRAAKIVTSLNHYSRKDRLPDQDCEINGIIDHCLVILESVYKDQVEIIRNYTSETYNLQGNSGKLHQAFLNVLTNAIQSISEMGSIVITTHLQKKRFVVTIQDNGCGISKDDLPKIMDPFFTNKPPGQGTGLGLSITQTIIREHNGCIGFDSQVGRGTKVVVSLPVLSVD